MIKLNKGGEPASLATNKVDWSRELLERINAGGDVPDSIYNRYNRGDVKEALRSECNSKCMYCESNVDHITHLHIEHILPKARHRFPERTFEFDNLGLACPKCNLAKSDKYDDDLPFLNPYKDEPSNHLFACGAFVYAKPGNRRARWTELEIDLNRAELVEKRGERFKVIRGLAEEYKRETNPSLKAALRRELLIECSEEKEYSFCCRTLVNALL